MKSYHLMKMRLSWLSSALIVSLVWYNNETVLIITFISCMLHATQHSSVAVQVNPEPVIHKNVHVQIKVKNHDKSVLLRFFDY